MPIGPLDDWFSIIFCDYGEEGVKFPIFRSYSKETAQRTWEKHKNKFSKNGWRCWQENKKGKILNDSNFKKNKVKN
jgi:Fe-S cluster biosynthesis and repair protein YggX